MEIVALILLGVTAFFIFKSFKKYEEINPYRGKNPDYNHAFTKTREANVYQEVLQSEYGLIAALTAKVAKADGKVCELESELIKNTLDELSEYFSQPGHAREILQRIFDEERSSHDNIEPIAKEFVNYTKKDIEKRTKVIDFLANLAFIDKHLSQEEEDVLRKIAFSLEIQTANFEAILNQFKSYYKNYKQPTANPYETLGVPSDVSEGDLKKKYRELVKENHPDIIKGQGLGDEFVEKATKKLQEINEAYEKIKKERGF